MSKHVEGVKGWNNLQHLQHTSIYIAFDDMVGKPKFQLSQILIGLKIG